MTKTLTPIDPAALAEDWISTEQAAEMLCVDYKALLKVRCQTIRHVPVAAAGRGYRYTWWRRDVEDLARLRKKANISLNVALRIMAAERPRNA